MLVKKYYKAISNSKNSKLQDFVLKIVCIFFEVLPIEKVYLFTPPHLCSHRHLMFFCRCFFRKFIGIRYFSYQLQFQFKFSFQAFRSCCVSIYCKICIFVPPIYSPSSKLYICLKNYSIKKRINLIQLKTNLIVYDNLTSNWKFN